MTRVIELRGCVEVPDDISSADFCNSFLEFLESKNWYYCGGMKEFPPEDDAERRVKKNINE